MKITQSNGKNCMTDKGIKPAVKRRRRIKNLAEFITTCVEMCCFLCETIQSVLCCACCACSLIQWIITSALTIVIIIAIIFCIIYIPDWGGDDSTTIPSMNRGISSHFYYCFRKSFNYFSFSF